ncbi:hypothetical protein CONCODRAFT_71966 [Conidiobolus coronatus NRRL 28638]|uniref:Uncharacterized protein n=1 Tax=Conidiobolus coronatus (strain ATCC 28846 / CBS 209.66 / NRRL 28638) TaxID=796925 RepID=A0A137P1S1_CONC2|nr:hypothetical protein CONCODRAFT_71966 [Conidiobolus coronatus NRRL 28638]|eukprot:KXN68829.1 hypothetical protein CONCODRAFT_71966 [Conidiobolus coronatus NRRL 28638]
MDAGDITVISSSMGAATILINALLLHFVLGNAIDDKLTFRLHLFTILFATISSIFISLWSMEAAGEDYSWIFSIFGGLIWVAYGNMTFWMFYRQTKCIFAKFYGIIFKGFVLSFTMMTIFTTVILGLVARYPDNDSYYNTSFGGECGVMIWLAVVTTVSNVVMIYGLHKIASDSENKSLNGLLIKMCVIMVLLLVFDIGLAVVQFFDFRGIGYTIRGCVYAFKVQTQYICLGKVEQCVTILKNASQNDVVEVNVSQVTPAPQAPEPVH